MGMIGGVGVIAVPLFDGRKGGGPSGEAAPTYPPVSSGNAADTAATFDARFSYDRLSASYLAYDEQMKVGAPDYAQTLDADKEAYFAILRQAKSSGGFDDPQAFLKTLGTDQLDVLQKTHSLAEPVQTASLSREAALNLILPFNESVDVDHDGLTQIGASTSMVFPPHDAPDNVLKAWKTATAGMDFGTVLTMQMQIGMASAGASRTSDAGSSVPGAALSLASGSGTAGWQALLDRTIAAADRHRVSENSDIQRAFGDRLRSGYQALKDAFTAGGVD